MNIISILRSIKLMNVAMKNSILTDKVKFETIHSNKCTIDLDSQDEDTESSCVSESFEISQD